MYLTPYDLHDIYAVFLLIRACPTDDDNALAVAAVKELVDAERGNFSRANAVRVCLGRIPDLDREKWFFVDTINVYTWMPPIIRDEAIYAILSACLGELLEALRTGDEKRVYDLADAIHNIPIILAKGGDTMRSDILREISYVYRPRWNQSFLQDLL